MSWECRGNRRYYYRSRRQGDRVIKQYVGADLLANQLAQEDELRHSKEQERRLAEQAERERLDLLDAPVRDLWKTVDCMVNAAMLLAGYRRHHRGEWRKSHRDQATEGREP
jgi:hypothetical protein